MTIPSEDLTHIKNVVFAGGGNRCFWQAGFWSVVAPRTGLAPQHVVSVSAGAALSCAILADRIEPALDATCAAMARNPKNQYWNHLFDGGSVFPHAAIYRAIMLEVLDAPAMARLQAGPDNHIALARPPAWLPARLATAAGMAAYQLEKQLFHPLHPRAGQILGFRPEYVSAQSCPDSETLANLVMASSCTPPFTPLCDWQGRPALDGGFVDNVPVAGVSPSSGDTLVLLSRPYGALPTVPGRLYVQPSSPVPVSAWDYTHPDRVRRTFQQGKHDGELFLWHYFSLNRSSSLCPVAG